MCTAGSQDAELLLHVKGGSCRRIQLRTVLPEGLVAFKSKLLNSGPVAVGRLATTAAEIVNRGTVDTSFRVSQALAMECLPNDAIIPAGDTLSLDLKFTPSEAGVFQSVLQLELRGGKIIKLPVTAAPTLPAVSIAEDEFDFGTEYQGGVQEKALTLVNTSPVDATVVVDLRPHPAFSLQLSKDDWSTTEYLHCPLTSDLVLEKAASLVSGASRSVSPSLLLLACSCSCDVPERDMRLCAHIRDTEKACLQGTSSRPNKWRQI